MSHADLMHQFGSENLKKLLAAQLQHQDGDTNPIQKQHLRNSRVQQQRVAQTKAQILQKQASKNVTPKAVATGSTSTGSASQKM